MKNTIQPRFIPSALCVVAGIGLLLPGALTALDTDRDGLSDDWERGVGRYEIVLGSFTWQQAKVDAESRGGHLATVVSDLEWLDLKNVLGEALHGRNLWLGGTDEGTEGSWRWVTGEPWGFTNWRAGEPGNDSLGNGSGVPENYLMIWGRETAALDNKRAYWNDATVTGGVLARDGYVFERGYWTDMNDPDTDDDGLADSEEGLGLLTYEVVRGVFDYGAAKAGAESRGGHLAVITTLAEWQAVQTALGASGTQSTLWLGASDAVQEGQWRWVTGEPFSFQNWASGQPDNLGNQDFLIMQPPFGQWSDTGSNTVTAGFLLEREGVFQTDPNNPDTDGDGLRDGDEAKFYKTNPGKVDTDGDSLSDFEELRRWRTNPLVTDSDLDGLTDGEEVFTYLTDPNKSDTDGDGFSDKVEVGYGSDPTLATSLPGPRSAIYTAVEIEFDTKLNEFYQIQILAGNGQWINYGAKIQGTGGVVNRLISTRPATKNFWRVLLAK